MLFSCILSVRKDTSEGPVDYIYFLGMQNSMRHRAKRIFSRLRSRDFQQAHLQPLANFVHTQKWFFLKNKTKNTLSLSLRVFDLKTLKGALASKHFTVFVFSVANPEGAKSANDTWYNLMTRALKNTISRFLIPSFEIKSVHKPFAI